MATSQTQRQLILILTIIIILKLQVSSKAQKNTQKSPDITEDAILAPKRKKYTQYASLALKNLYFLIKFPVLRVMCVCRVYAQLLRVQGNLRIFIRCAAVGVCDSSVWNKTKVDSNDNITRPKSALAYKTGGNLLKIF